MKITTQSRLDLTILAGGFHGDIETLREYAKLQRRYGPNLERLQILYGEHISAAYPCVFHDVPLFYVSVMSRDGGIARSVMNYLTNQLKLRRFETKDSELEKEIKCALVTLSGNSRTVAYPPILG